MTRPSCCRCQRQRSKRHWRLQNVLQQSCLPFEICRRGLRSQPPDAADSSPFAQAWPCTRAAPPRCCWCKSSHQQLMRPLWALTIHSVCRLCTRRRHCNFACNLTIYMDLSSSRKSSSSSSTSSPSGCLADSRRPARRVSVTSCRLVRRRLAPPCSNGDKERCGAACSRGVNQPE